MDPCIADGCRKPAEKDRKYCHGHRKREKQGRPIDTPLREHGTDPGSYLAAKAIGYADAKDDNRAKLALKLLKYAAKQYAAKCQKVPKSQQTPK